MVNTLAEFPGLESKIMTDRRWGAWLSGLGLILAPISLITTNAGAAAIQGASIGLACGGAIIYLGNSYVARQLNRFVSGVTESKVARHKYYIVAHGEYRAPMETITQKIVGQLLQDGFKVAVNSQFHIIGRTFYKTFEASLKAGVSGMTEMFAILYNGRKKDINAMERLLTDLQTTYGHQMIPVENGAENGR